MKFLSDNTAPAAPEVMAAIAACNTGMARAYGADDGSSSLDEAFARYFGKPVRVFPVSTGTAANALALATMVAPYGEILATGEAHILRDECGACELQTAGARLTALPSSDGRLALEVLAAHLADHPPSVHSVQPAAVSITQSTECGTVYRVEQVRALAEVAHAADLALHMDGARFANALAFLGCTPAAATWQAGVDVLSFGATKNGALTAEAVIFFDPARAADFELRRKRAGHLLSKMRFVSAQLLACIEGDFFAANAARANRLAARIGAAAGPRRLYPVEANAVFLRLDAAEQSQLRQRDFDFYPWGPPRTGGTRFVVSWNQPESDVDALCEVLAAWS